MKEKKNGRLETKKILLSLSLLKGNFAIDWFLTLKRREGKRREGGGQKSIRWLTEKKFNRGTIFELQNSVML